MLTYWSGKFMKILYEVRQLLTLKCYVSTPHAIWCKQFGICRSLHYNHCISIARQLLTFTNFSSTCWNGFMQAARQLPTWDLSSLDCTWTNKSLDRQLLTLYNLSVTCCRLLTNLFGNCRPETQRLISTKMESLKIRCGRQLLTLLVHLFKIGIRVYKKDRKRNFSDNIFHMLRLCHLLIKNMVQQQQEYYT